MNRIFEIDTEIEELNSFIPFLKKSCDAKIEFSHINNRDESEFYRHKDGTRYKMDFNSLSTLFITVSGTITSLIALITALVTYKIEKKKSNDRGKDNKILVTYKKRTILITDSSIIEEIVEEIRKVDATNLEE